MKQTIYGLFYDLGDGSSTINWFRNPEKVAELLDEDNMHEEYWLNEGEPAVELEFPADLDLKSCGFQIRD